jgi:hypothetical protein
MSNTKKVTTPMTKQSGQYAPPASGKTSKLGLSNGGKKGGKKK